MKSIKRQLHSNELLIKSGKQIITLNRDKFLQKNNIFGIIRIQKEDFIFLKKNPQLLTHFNLQFTGHQKGKIYALLLIVKPGFLTEKEEVPPLLSLEEVYVTECLEVRNNLKYEELKKEDFKYSFPKIKNVEQLKEVIVKRYSQSMPNLSQKNIFSLGVAITKLKIIKKTDIKDLSFLNCIVKSLDQQF